MNMNKLKNLPIVLLLAVLFSKTTTHAQFVKVDSLFWVLANDEFMYPIDVNSKEINLNLSNVPAGHYLLKLIADEVVTDFKAVVKI